MTRGWLAAALVITLAAGCDGDESAAPLPSPRSTPKVSPSPRLKLTTKPQTYASGLNFPVDMAWQRGTDRIFFTQKSGAIRVMVGRRVLPRPCARLPVDFQGERGALGIELHPEFDANHWLYVYYTNAEPLENRVARFTVEGNTCTDPVDVVTGIPADASGRHNGGQIEVVDDYLFVAIGDGYSDPSVAQDVSADQPLGKVLRFTDEGEVPPENPRRDNPLWTFGHRNPFGLAYDPASGALYASENGPSCDDEVNHLDPGQNYGWGTGAACGTAGVGPRPVEPMLAWTPNIIPTDLWFYRGPIASLDGSLLMGDFSSGRLHQLVLDAAGSRVVADRILYDFPEPVVDVSEGPGGYIYVLTPDSILRFVTRQQS